MIPQYSVSYYALTCNLSLSLSLSLSLYPHFVSCDLQLSRYLPHLPFLFNAYTTIATPRRTRVKQPHTCQDQPSPAPSQPVQTGGAGVRSLPVSGPPPVPSLAMTPSVMPDAPSGSPDPRQPPAAASSAAPSAVLALSSELQQQLSLTPPEPSSSKAVRFADRPNYGQVGKKIQVRANHFLVQAADRDLHHYDVSITPEVSSKLINRNVMNKLYELYKESHLGKRMPAYDGRKSLFTAGPLPFSSKEFVVKLVHTDEPPASSSSSLAPLRKEREREFKVLIRYASKADLHHLQRFLRRLQLDHPQEAIQALDIVLRTSPSEKYTVVGRSFFSPNLGQQGVLGYGMEYWRGYHQSIRPTQMGLSLNIDISARSFYEPILVTDFVVKHFDFNMSRPLSEEDRVKVRKALKGIKVEVTHGKYSRSYKITGLSKDPLNSLLFTLNDKKSKKSVVQYFRENYNIALKYLALPALLAGSDLKPVFLPMEVCQIAAGQRYSRKLNEKQVTALLKATCQRPQDRENYIKQMVRQNNFNSDKTVQEFGIQVREELAVVNARVLPAPKLRYHDTGKERWVDPWMGQWNMMNKKMIDGSKVLYWTCVNFSARVNKDLPFQFCSELISMCNSKGMVFSRDPLLSISSAHPTQIEKALIDIHKHSTAKLARMNNQQTQLQLLIVILPDTSGSYGKIKKICETELGIVSQCCLPKNASKMNKQYLENVALKINVKAGGRNTALNDAVQKNIPHVSDRPTIIFGADVTHPQPGEDMGPSIAAVVASMDWPWVTNYRGIVSAQPHREEIIQDLYKTLHDPQKGTVHGGMIRELLVAFYRSTRCKPDRIIFYRDGVSEGQFSQVLLHEMEAIRKKRHHTRLFPVDHQSRDQTDKSGNIQPGTVVDTSICHPREYDFYLNSHAGIQGTSRPTHYHVLYDENKFKADELQTLTNNLCYTYARCTRSVSIVPPAYYAHLAAFRARYYVEGELSERGSGVGSRSTKVEVILPSIKENVKEVMFYC